MLIIGRSQAFQYVEVKGPFDTNRVPSGTEMERAEELPGLPEDFQSGFDSPTYWVTVLDGTRTLTRGVDALFSSEARKSRMAPITTLLWETSQTQALTACAALAELCSLIAAARPDANGAQFLQLLGEQAAGVDPGLPGLLDLLAGGEDVLPGVGFGDAFVDGSLGQVRHFVGVAVAAARIGGAVTEALSRLRGDSSGSADDNLSRAAIEFADSLSSGQLSIDAASSFIRRRLCRPPEAAVQKGLAR